MTLVKKQYNGRELPVFDNMDQAREHFSKARKTILGVMIAFSACYSFFVAVLAFFSQQLGLDGLIVGFVFGFAIYSASCCTEADIRAPKQFKVFYSEKDKKWLLFPADEYPAVAFVLENEYDMMKEDYTMDDYVIDASDRYLKKNTVANRIFVTGIFLSAILLPIAPVLSNVIAIGTAIVCRVIRW